MSDTLEYIESYFEKKLSPADKQVFEQRCVQDENFAGEVAFYITSREAVRQKLLEKKRAVWASAEQDTSGGTVTAPAPVKRMVFAKWLPYAAAACLLLAACIYFLYPSQSPQRLADNYIEKNMQVLSISMSGATDSLQSGISAYNAKKYDEAEKIFTALSYSSVTRSEVQKYLGILYLVTKRYDRALIQFEALAGNDALYINWGLFYKAVTLMKRGAGSDVRDARKILEEVSSRNLPGSPEAKAWIEKF